MKISYPKCRRARLKGGAELHVIDGGSPDLTGNLIEAARHTTDICPDMAGYAIVAWDFRGLAARTWEYHKGSPIKESLIPSYVRDILLKEITKSQTFEDLGETES